MVRPESVRTLQLSKGMKRLGWGFSLFLLAYMYLAIKDSVDSGDFFKMLPTFIIICLIGMFVISPLVFRRIIYFPSKRKLRFDSLLSRKVISINDVHYYRITKYRSGSSVSLYGKDEKMILHYDITAINPLTAERFFGEILGEPRPIKSPWF